SIGEETIALLTGSRALSVWCQVARRGERRPRFANFAVIPASRVGQLDCGIDCLNLRSMLGADALNTQDVDSSHVTLSEPCNASTRPERALKHVPLRLLPPSRRHARACRGHPRLSCGASASKTWMAGTSPAMTLEKWFNMTGTCL